MANTLSYSGMAPAVTGGTSASASDGTEVGIAPALLTLTGSSAQPVPTGALGWMRFANAYTPTSAAGVVADLFMVGGINNTRQWQMITYTNTAGALSAAATLTLSDCSPASASGNVAGQAPALLALTGGVQGTYPAGAPWYRFATAFSPANGQTVADLVMLGGPNNTERWFVTVYTVTGGVLS